MQSVNQSVIIPYVDISFQGFYKTMFAKTNTEAKKVKKDKTEQQR